MSHWHHKVADPLAQNLLMRMMVKLMMRMMRLVMRIMRLAYTQNTYGTNTYRYLFRR